MQGGSADRAVSRAWRRGVEEDVGGVEDGGGVEEECSGVPAGGGGEDCGGGVEEEGGSGVEEKGGGGGEDGTCFCFGTHPECHHHGSHLYWDKVG